MIGKGQEISLVAAETALSEGRVPTAAGIYSSWRRRGSRPRDGGSIIRGQLLAAHLDLLAGNLRAVEIRLRYLQTSMQPYLLAPLRARLLVSRGTAAEGHAVLTDALNGLQPAEDPSARAELRRQRGLLALETGDLLASLADFDEAESYARHREDAELVASIQLDRAEAFLSAGETDGARAAIPAEGGIPPAMENRRRSLISKLDGKSICGDTETLIGAESNLARACSDALNGKHDEAGERLATLEAVGWFSAVEAFRAESVLIDALILHKSGENQSALKQLTALRHVCSPGAVRRLGPSADWLRMRIALAAGDHRKALGAGRRLLASLESLRHGILSLDHLRRISGSHSEIYSEIIGLELRCGDAKRAYNALQQFSARALLRKTAGKGWIPGISNRENHGLKLALRRFGSTRRDALRWPQLVKVLEKLGSEQ